MSQTYLFQHEAMKTTFTLRLISEDAMQAKNVALASIELIDTIEQTLSRYIEGSDVWQINHMASGETRFLTEHCYNCLRIALEVCAESKGLFDITLGAQIEHTKNKIEGPVPPLNGQLMLDPDRPAIHCIEAGREIDLGGIGKGYALDQIKQLAQGWGIESALISAGASTQLAFGSTAWPIQLEGDYRKEIIELKNQALSASGTSIQGSHIISPKPQPEDVLRNRIWVLDANAARADAWSTAALLMDTPNLEALKDRVQIITDDPNA